jgi:hypothetical protein
MIFGWGLGSGLEGLIKMHGDGVLLFWNSAWATPWDSAWAWAYIYEPRFDHYGHSEKCSCWSGYLCMHQSMHSSL